MLISGFIMINSKRRDFLKMAACGGALAAAGSLARAAAPEWKKQIGLEMYTVRDLMAKDYEGTYAKVAEIGYKEVEPASNGYGNMEPKQFRAMLDRYGLSMPSTHVGATAGPGLEKQLEGFQIMGLKYTEISGGGAPRPQAASGGARKAPQAGPPPVTEESVKRTAALLNEHGKIAGKFGMKMLYHNHAPEFQPFEGSEKRPYDILLAETDPSLVAMQLDIGWASVAGQNVLEMFKKNPGRFELWHVKDARGIKSLDPHMNQRDRMRAIMLVPVGQGEVDYRPFFANAELAGMKHFCIEQDNAADWGDSMAAARISFEKLSKLL
jgi:sugar phosphate isomerase/epimerase